MQTKTSPQTLPHQAVQSTVDPEVPESLREWVTRTPKALTLKRLADGSAHAAWIAGGLLTTLVAACGLLMAISMLLLAFISGEVLLVLLAAGMLGSAGLAGSFILWATAPLMSPFLAVRIDRDGAVRSGLLSRSLTKSTHLTLCGEVGTPIEVYLYGKEGSLRLVRANPRQTLRWSLSSLMWFAQAVADLQGVPLHDELDHPSWSRWLTDEHFRQRTKFIRDHKTNLQWHPKWHALTPTTSHITYEHHAASTRHLTIDAEHATDRRRSIPLTHILAVSVRFNTVRVNKQTQHFGMIRVLTTSGVVGLASRQIVGSAHASRVHGLAELLRKHALDAQPNESRGTSEDIPEALRVIRGDAAQLEAPPQGPVSHQASSNPA